MHKILSSLLLLLFLLVSGCGKVVEKEKQLPRRQTPANLSATDYFKQALVLADSARFDSAIYNFRQAATGFQQQKDWHAYITCLNEIGENYKELEQTDSAGVYLDMALNQGIQLMGTQSAAVAQAYNNLGELRQLQSQTDTADSLFAIALQIRRKLYGENHVATAESLYNKGNMYAEKGEYKQAAKLQEKALQISLKYLGKWHKQVGLIYKALGGISYDLSEYDKALDYYTLSMGILTKVLGKNHPQLGKAYTYMGMIYRVRGNGKRAKGYYEKALPIYNHSLGNESKYVAITYNNMANLDLDNGDYERAIIYFKNAIEIMSKQDDYGYLSFIYNNIGVAFKNIEDTDKALESYEKALEIIINHEGPDHYFVPFIYTNIGVAYDKKGDYDQAFDYYNKALKIYASTVEEMHPDIALCYINMADIYLKEKNYNHALLLYKKGLQIFNHNYKEQNLKIVEAYTAIGNTWAAKSDIDSALFYYDKAINSLAPDYNIYDFTNYTDLEKIELRPHLINVLAAKANALKKLYHTSGNYLHIQESLINIELAVHLIDYLRNMYKGEEAKLFLSKNTNPVYQQALATASILYTLTKDDSYMQKAFTFSEKSKAAVLLDVTKKISAQYTAGIPDAVLAEEEEIRSLIAFYEKLAFDAKQQDSIVDKAKIREWEELTTNYKRKYTELILSLEKDYPAYYRLKYDSKMASIEDIRQQLRPKQALIEYALADSSLYIFTITPAASSLTWVENTTDLTQQVQLLRKALQDKNFDIYTKEALRLYHTLIQPVNQYIQGIENLVIIPDGILNYVPFEILLKDDTYTEQKSYALLPYLVKDYRTNYNYSSTLLLENQRNVNRKPKKNYIGFAPFFAETDVSAEKAFAKISNKSNPQEPLPQLNGAKQEIKDISAIFDGQYFIDTAATEARFKQLAAQYGILHLATHAVINDQRPEYSKLLFAKESASREDGELHTFELYNLKLNAYLVTLSACNTGIGKIEKGEGVMSLARGFAYAGCPNVVMSLWPATDQATSLIIKEFYQGIHKGLDKDEALYQAKIHYLQSADDHTANPYFWGSFVLIGDTSPLPITNNTYYFWIISICILLGAGAIYFAIASRKKANVKIHNV